MKEGEVWLINSNIPEFSHGNRYNHEPKRARKLLLNAREINKLFGAVAREGMTLVPLSVYFNARGRAKVELALAKGRKLHDKRHRNGAAYTTTHVSRGGKFLRGYLPELGLGQFAGDVVGHAEIEQRPLLR